MVIINRRLKVRLYHTLNTLGLQQEPWAAIKQLNFLLPSHQQRVDILEAFKLSLVNPSDHISKGGGGVGLGWHQQHSLSLITHASNPAHPCLDPSHSVSLTHGSSGVNAVGSCVNWGSKLVGSVSESILGL